ncbi:hypothetical protein C5S32_09265 [ANME-1 cluster archaeon GoMg1]|nr:hypothetical protein [ANME-1 cluster archaeon GoMg1]
MLFRMSIGKFIVQLSKTFYIPKTYTVLDFLRPNQKSPFDLSPYPEKIEPASYELSVTWREAPFEGLEIISHSSHITSSGYHRIFGTVKNNGSEEAEYVKVVCTFETTLTLSD